ncbi:GntR family transcriptional regulator [Aminobacter sp. NyZ550]|uniref:GntR family transcriptional regulator n=2 Tax=Aminobacter TaxID=31988 RepID=A0AAC8YKW4_AMIAI|nr:MULTISPECIES: GntR family transcriptional regulator [Aminobacter]AMS40028.1 GntR family transcriptional regulator [Aminobacter aminovorans]MBA8909822.1 DNA-binding GntR family transcriptional regulator [Aminobacter ciceronei]MBA9023582.1 DNA-binding GntR family transcriptional regulator [Aminobacter ciceronei]MBB3709351.1 DNA-binding GntR family transcriptional regulator [Aminobacter aminovorans]MRX36754.1 FCD domain-containing protein [Aminobacter sp. MDW-2]
MTTIASQIYQALAEEIAKGVMVPGQKLEEKVIAEKFGVSRTPVRDALRELGARGLIEMNPRRGGVVARIDTEQMADMLEAECEIEALCARLAAQRMSALEREQLYELHRQYAACAAEKDIEGCRDINRKFHDAICRGAHSVTITAMAVDLRVRLAPFRQHQAGPADIRLQQSLDEHQKVVDAIRANDGPAAFAALYQHNARLSAGVMSRFAAEAAK